ncbi:MAG: hypothetical protein N4A38_01120 [Candidatus Gracilibacteria bacterium]|nr:hypothetical protein [Candidatus Gracilibacteria bacterium]
MKNEINLNKDLLDSVLEEILVEYEFQDINHKYLLKDKLYFNILENFEWNKKNPNFLSTEESVEEFKKLDRVDYKEALIALTSQLILLQNNIHNKNFLDFNSGKKISKVEFENVFGKEDEDGFNQNITLLSMIFCNSLVHNCE